VKARIFASISLKSFQLFFFLVDKIKKRHTNNCGVGGKDTERVSENQTGGSNLKRNE
jgi:hypothetical protein